MIRLFATLTRHRASLLHLSAALLLFVAASFGQNKPGETNTVAGNEEIHGTVKFPSGQDSGAPVTVILRSLSSPEIKAFTNRDGEFRFTHLRPDSYTVIVDAGEAYEKATETVSIGFSGAVPAQGNPFSYAHPAVYEVRIYLAPKGAASGRSAMSELSSAKISGEAKKYFRQALEDQRSGKHQQAIEHLKAVILKSPDFAPAYVELGAEYLKTGEGQLAVDTLRKAVEVDPADPSVRLNYGVALLNQKQLDAAEAELRLSIQKSKEYSVAAHYYLGVTLLAERRIDEARTLFEDIVKNGGGKLPLVHRYLGGIYLQDKQYRRAADELDRYLKLDPKAVDAEKIREMIKESRDKS